MIFSIQHNGRGKSHLVNEDAKTDDIICGSFGSFNFTDTKNIVDRDGELYEVSIHRTEFPIFTPYYCKKCIKKAKELINH